MLSIYWLSLIAGLVTGIGALIAFLIKEPSNKLLSLALGFASGIMIGISALSLIPESLAAGNTFSCVIGFALGASFLWIIDILLPHIHKIEADCEIYAKMGYFIAMGIALHNLPEGIAIGASNEISVNLGFNTAVSIGFHNIAEGLSVAMPLCLGKIQKGRVIVITTLTGLATLVGTIIGVFIMNISTQIISGSLAFAAGAMVFISSDELIPHSHSVHSHAANAGILLGIAAAIILI